MPAAKLQSTHLEQMRYGKFAVGAFINTSNPSIVICHITTTFATYQQPSMLRIGLLADTHGFLDPKIAGHFAEVDEIWHAGDFGQPDVVAGLEAIGKPLRGVWGNIDDQATRRRWPEDMRFTLEGVDVFMTHIGGYPGKYDPRVKKLLKADPPVGGLFICGHSHILKAMADKQLGFFHLNPGACGHEGWHTIRTIMRFTLEAGKIKDLEAIELGRRGSLAV
jgi:uncharacterized protein